jgi:hypothetical protein
MGHKALSKEEWIEHPFSGERYALVFVVADVLIRSQIEAKVKSGTTFGKPKGRYGQVYVDRRMHTATTHPDWSAGHAHKDGLRIMVKALLKALWIEWNRLAGVDRPWQQAAE